MVNTGFGSFTQNPLINLIPYSFITYSSLILDCSLSATLFWEGDKDVISPLRSAVHMMTQNQFIRQTIAVSPGEDLNQIQIFSWGQSQFKSSVFSNQHWNRLILSYWEISFLPIEILSLLGEPRSFFHCEFKLNTQLQTYVPQLEPAVLLCRIGRIAQSRVF